MERTKKKRESRGSDAVQDWIYQPLAYENRPCEVVSRVEIRFDSEFAHSVASD